MAHTDRSPVWLTAVATGVGYGLLLGAMFILLFFLPYVAFTIG